MAEEFKLPDLGEGIHEAQIIQILVKEGDEVRADQPLMEVETDKAAVEIPSPESGKIEKIHVHSGQTVNVGETLITFGGNGKAQSDSEAVQPPVGRKSTGKDGARGAPRTAVSDPPQAAAGEDDADRRWEQRSAAKAGRPAKVAASPVVRRLAKEHDIDLAVISGSGPGGRVTRDDLEAAISGSGSRRERTAARDQAGLAATMPEKTDLPDFTKWGSIRREPIPQIRKAIARQMVRSETTNVHVTHHDVADITMLEQLRKDHNARRQAADPKLTLLPFVIKAIYAAMRQYPVFNASFDQDNSEVIYKEYFHFGIAVDTPRGLVVPVVRDVDRRSIREIAVELAALGERTRQADFAIEELRGGTFTITNIGVLGGIVSTPVINYPEVAILGLGKAEMRPVVHDGNIVARYILPLNLSFDHRIIDGADAARFCSAVIRYLEVPGRLLLED